MRDRPTMEGELALRGPIPFGTIALFGCAIVVTMTSAPLALIALLAGLEPGSPASMRDGASLLSLASMLWALIFALEARRRARRPRVTWDAWGIFEWDSDAVRTAIPWDAARAEVRTRDGNLEWAHVFDDAGRCITICARNALAPAWQPPRDCECDDLAPLAGRLAVLPRGRARPDVRDRVRPDAWWAQLRVLLPGVVLASLLFVWLPPAWVLTGVLAATALALSTIPAVVELVRLARLEWARRDLVPLRIDGAEGSVVLARDEVGRELRLDARGWSLSDGSLGPRRRGVVLARLGASVRDAGPYRDGLGAHGVDVAETPFDRTFRRRRLAVASLELVVRLAALVVVARIVWAMIEWLVSLM